MDYQVLSRRYRPKLFSEVIGQESIIKILNNSITSGKIPHAFLFTGIRGTGKTTTARILARALNCKDGVVVDPCNKCESCVQLLEGRSMDVMEIDGASNTSVNDVRMLKENTRFLPSQLRYKIYIIDEVHMLSTEAFNALLKTLEEPPPHVVFILATTEPQKIPETVLSRCIRLNFRRVEPKDIVSYLSKVLTEEVIIFEESSLFLIARQSEGSVRDALSFLELVLAYGGGRVTENDVVQVLGLLSREKIFEFLYHLSRKDAPALLSVLSQIRSEGGDLFGFLENAVFYIRHLVLNSMSLSFDEREFSQDEVKRLEKISEEFTAEELTVYYQGLRQLMEQLRFSTHPQFDVEIGMIKLVILKDFLEGSPVFKTKTQNRVLVADQGLKQVPEVETGSWKPEDKTSVVEKLKSSEKTVAGFLNFLRQKKPLMASQIENAAMELNGSELKLSFSDKHQIFYEHLNHDEAERAQLINLAEEFFSEKMKISFKIKKNQKTEAVAKNESVKEGVMKNQKIGLILSEFEGAKIVDIKKSVKREILLPKENEEIEIKEEVDE
jgi:DNA polymerase-3 subunit gamma/tau